MDGQRQNYASTWKTYVKAITMMNIDDDEVIFTMDSAGMTLNILISVSNYPWLLLNKYFIICLLFINLLLLFIIYYNTYYLCVLFIPLHKIMCFV